LRAARCCQVAILEEPLTGYRDTNGSLGKQAETMRRGLLRIHDKLEKRDVWNGRWLLKRKARAHVDYSTGYMCFAAGDSWQATSLLVQSLLRYPIPMSPPDVHYRFARFRLLARALLASVGHRAPFAQPNASPLASSSPTMVHP